MPTRRIWIGPQMFTTSAGVGSSPVAKGDTSQNVYKPGVWVFPANTVGIVTTTFIMPYDWDDGTNITAIYHWSRGSGTNGGCDWEWVWAHIDLNEQVDKTGTVVKPGSPPMGPATPQDLVLSTIGTFTWSPGTSAYRTFRAAVRRQDDALAAEAWLLGVELQYSAIS